MTTDPQVLRSTVLERWTGPDRPRFARDALVQFDDVCVADEGVAFTGDHCCCAQGWVLLWGDAATPDELANMDSDDADWLVAQLLGISRTHSVLLRVVNDSGDGCPELVLSAPEQLLGPRGREILRLWEQWDHVRVDLPSWQLPRAESARVYGMSRTPDWPGWAVCQRIEQCCATSPVLMEASLELHIDGSDGSVCRAIWSAPQV